MGWGYHVPELWPVEGWWWYATFQIQSFKAPMWYSNPCFPFSRTCGGHVGRWQSHWAEATQVPHRGKPPWKAVQPIPDFTKARKKTGTPFCHSHARAYSYSIAYRILSNKDMNHQHIKGMTFVNSMSIKFHLKIHYLVIKSVQWFASTMFNGK